MKIKLTTLEHTPPRTNQFDMKAAQKLQGHTDFDPSRTMAMVVDIHKLACRLQHYNREYPRPTKEFLLPAVTDVIRPMEIHRSAITYIAYLDRISILAAAHLLDRKHRHSYLEMVDNLTSPNIPPSSNQIGLFNCTKTGHFNSQNTYFQ